MFAVKWYGRWQLSEVKSVWHDNGQYAITVKGDERHVEECADRCNVAPSWCRRQLRVAGIGEWERERFEVLGSA